MREHGGGVLVGMVIGGWWAWLSGGGVCKGNLTDLRRILHLSLAKGNPK
jgi:hypothetical protein